MRKKAEVVFACLGALLTASCVPELSIEKQPCPCGDGWRCDESGGAPGVCVRPDSGPGVKADSGAGPCTPAWEAMITGASELAGIWGASASDVFAVGPFGKIVHYDGTSWTPMTSPSQQHWMAVWGASNRDVFAVGGDFGVAAAIHYDGSTWREISPTAKLDLGSVWGTSRTDVFAGAGAMGTGGHGGMILHYDGSTWTTQYASTSNQEQIMDVWGAGPRDAFAVGRGGETPGCPVLHYDGVSWSRIPSVTVNNLWAIHGQGNLVLAAGDTILQCDATQCDFMAGAPTATAGQFMDVRVVGPECVYAVGESGKIVHFDGKTWRSEPSGKTIALRAIWAADCDHVFVAATDGTVLRRVCE